ncbi:hypothetical protein AKJ09_00606 [Labilithrix luteola]|uniref:Uncharacterized protein n=1 Tax=Labilithrix luteola TaxID=1391654 RepID=A0A0K1PK98_9BACT|nr:hypothetical protein [Labilithrix luteola]AKU93942.1 hypothetical protein AKJ09_00606 [Labilithrix luteola]
MSAQLEEVGRTADAIRSDIETAFVRGLATSSKGDRRGLEARTEEWERVGAHHVATRLRAALRAADADTKDAATKFLSAYTSLHAFERVLSLEAARGAWATYRASRDDDEDQEPTKKEPPAESPAALPPPLEDPKGAVELLGELTKLVEDLVRTGLTSASQATRTRLDHAFKEASRRKLLRLGASLRYVNEEIGRFLADDGTFAARRYSFFLHRSWLLAKGTHFAIGKKDARLVGSLTLGVASAPKPVGALEVVTLGVQKRATAAACSFDFRLRVVKSARASLVGQALVYSLVFARKAGVPPEAYLHLPQPQKFAPKVLVAKSKVSITEAAVLEDGRGGGRLVLGPKSTVTGGADYDAWSSHYTWDPDGAAARVDKHAPSPLDLAVEMQEEVILEEWALGPAPDGGLLILIPGLSFSVTLPSGEEGQRLKKTLETAAKKKKNRPSLLGAVHYEFGQLVLAPISLLDADGPEHILLSDENINLSALLGSLNLGG